MTIIDQNINDAIKRVRGLSLHNGSLRLQFKLPGSSRATRKSLGYPATIANIKLAELTLANIKGDIANGLFANNEKSFWLSHFPTSSVIGNSQITVRECFEAYININQAALSDSVIDKLGTALNWLDHYGYAKKNLAELTRSALNLLRNKSVNGNKKGKFSGCRVSTVNEYTQTFGQVLGFAVEERFIEETPIKNLGRLVKDDSNLDPESRNVKPFTQFELDSLLAVIHVKHVKLMVKLLAWSGLRHGELKALAWEDINLDQKTLTVRYNLTRKGKLKPPKTVSGYRTIELLPAALDVLIQMEKETAHFPAIEDKIHYKHNKYELVKRRRVFLSRESKPYKRPELTTAPKQWEKWLREADIPYRAAYQLRHTFASQLLTAGCEMSWLAGQMGHKDWNMISKIYGRWIPEDNPNYIQNMALKLGQSYQPS